MSNIDRDRETGEERKKRKEESRKAALEAIKARQLQDEKKAQEDRDQKTRQAQTQAANPPTQYNAPMSANPPSNAMEQNQQKLLAEQQLAEFFKRLDADKTLD